MQGFERAADLPERLSDVYSAIAQELERQRVTTLYTTETRGLFESDIHVPINGLSAATQNIILLRHVEHRAAILRALAILKVQRRRLRPDRCAKSRSPTTASGCSIPLRTRPT